MNTKRNLTIDIDSNCFDSAAVSAEKAKVIPNACGSFLGSGLITENALRES